MPTTIVKNTIMRNAAIGLAMLAICSVAQPSVVEYHLDSSGVVTIGDGIQLDLRSYPKDWNIYNSSGLLPVAKEPLAS